MGPRCSSSRMREADDRTIWNDFVVATSLQTLQGCCCCCSCLCRENNLSPERTSRLNRGPVRDQPPLTTATPVCMYAVALRRSSNVATVSVIDCIICDPATWNDHVPGSFFRIRPTHRLCPLSGQTLAYRSEWGFRAAAAGLGNPGFLAVQVTGWMEWSLGSLLFCSSDGKSASSGC